MENYEKLGVFYLGRYREGETGESTAQPFLYDSRDLLTHAVCVGMTGSGKTGLCLGLLEEAAIDGIPALIVDPKGDLGNLLLTFPNLAPDDFLPWVDAEEAQRKGMSREALAAATAKRWAEGLAKWDQSGERSARLREAAEFAIYPQRDPRLVDVGNAGRGQALAADIFVGLAVVLPWLLAWAATPTRRWTWTTKPPSPPPHSSSRPRARGTASSTPQACCMAPTACLKSAWAS